MTTRATDRQTGPRRSAALGVTLLLALSGCGLDETVIPDFHGPAELGFALTLAASPDVITADGFSTSSIQATARGPNGEPIVGATIVFAIADESGLFADIGTLVSTSGDRLHAATATATTGATGVAQVIYRAPARTDATANQGVVVSARPVGNDAFGAVYRTVLIELKSAEPRMFPQVPQDDFNCNFTVEPSIGEYHVNEVISFQSTASDPDGKPIIRYEWDFGDGGRAVSPDAAHVYTIPDTYTVVHACTNADGFLGVPFSVDLIILP